MALTPPDPTEYFPQRHHWWRETAPLPEMPAFGWGDHMRYTGPGLEAHQHDGYEICYIVRGGVEWWVGREIHHVRRGEMYVTRPGEIHGGVDSLLHRCELYWVLVRFPQRGALAGMNVKETSQIRAALDALKFRCFPGSAPTVQTLDAMHQILLHPGRWRDVALRAHFHQFLLQTLADHDAAAAGGQGRAGEVSTPIRAALAWIESHLAEDFAIEAVAAAAGLGISRFHERFVAEVGYSPGDYRTRLRVRRARQMLTDSALPVTDIAMRLGFATSQYFATVFRKVAGVSPRRYRAQHAPQNSE